MNTKRNGRDQAQESIESEEEGIVTLHRAIEITKTKKLHTNEGPTITFSDTGTQTLTYNQRQHKTRTQT